MSNMWNKNLVFRLLVLDDCKTQSITSAAPTFSALKVLAEWLHVSPVCTYQYAHGYAAHEAYHSS
jgi:hypothetical protein